MSYCFGGVPVSSKDLYDKSAGANASNADYALFPTFTDLAFTHFGFGKIHDRFVHPQEILLDLVE